MPPTSDPQPQFTNVVFAIVLILLARSHMPPGAIFFAAGEPTNHLRFWSAVAFLGLLQVTAAVLNVLPVPGLDGYAVIEPYLDRDTVQVAEKIKPWRLLIVIALLLYAPPLRGAFFDLVNAIYRGVGGDDQLPSVGHFFFKFWTRQAP